MPGGSNMKCPYCGKEMEKGRVVQAYGRQDPIMWKPIDENRGFIDGLLNRDKRNIDLTLFWDAKFFVAYICKDCRKLISDI
jgi:hypothetical protein